MKLIADMHCHTIASAHAYSTILENINVAAERGLSFLAITEHSEKTIGGPRDWYFENLKIIPKNVNSVNILKGIESNVLNSSGELDFPPKLKTSLNWVVASIHSETFREEASIEFCTETWLNIAKNPLVNVIGHSGTEDYKYDYETVIKKFGENGKLVEINNSSFFIRKGSIKTCKQIALTCKRLGIPIIVNSDAHFCTLVGNFDYAFKLLEEIDFPEELIINADEKRFVDYLKKYTNFYE